VFARKKLLVAGCWRTEAVKNRGIDKGRFDIEECANDQYGSKW